MDLPLGDFHSSGESLKLIGGGQLVYGGLRSMEKRANDRRRVLRAGKIVLNKHGSVIDCTVRNISKTGALIGVLSAVTVPEEFILRWDGIEQSCKVVWRKPDRMGLKFTC